MARFVQTVETGAAEVVARPAIDPMDDPTEAVDHLVCCRHTWTTAMCGADVSDDYVTLIVDRLCPLCVEAARSALAARGLAFPGSPPNCPADGTKCPVADELDALVERHVRDG